jgi:hypothetical protein
MGIVDYDSLVVSSAETCDNQGYLGFCGSRVARAPQPLRPYIHGPRIEETSHLSEARASQRHIVVRPLYAPPPP